VRHYLETHIQLASFQNEKYIVTKRERCYYTPNMVRSFFMAVAIIFDIHENVKRLKAAGFSEEQAEAQTRIIAELVDKQLVTRQYLDDHLKELEYRLVIRLGAMLVVAIGVVATLVKIL
jgi:hypothetical protein